MNDDAGPLRATAAIPGRQREPDRTRLLHRSIAVWTRRRNHRLELRRVPLQAQRDARRLRERSPARALLGVAFTLTRTADADLDVTPADAPVLAVLLQAHQRHRGHRTPMRPSQSFA